MRKLQPYQVILIRQMHREGFKRKFLARLFQISRSSIQCILSRSNYKEIR